VQRLRTRPRGGGPRPGPSSARVGGEPRVAGGHSPVVSVRLPCGGRRRRLSMGTGSLGVLTACWVRAEVDDRMRLNNWSIAASYDTARIFAGLGFGSSTVSRSIISRRRRTGLCSGSMQGVGALLGYALVPLGEARFGRIGFDEWLRRSQARARSRIGGTPKDSPVARESRATNE